MHIYNKLFHHITQHIKNVSNCKSKQAYNHSTRLFETRVSIDGRMGGSSFENDCSYIDVLLEWLRVPLCCYIEYKGICALAEDRTNIDE
jgi:hypothetical protein